MEGDSLNTKLFKKGIEFDVFYEKILNNHCADL